MDQKDAGTFIKESLQDNWLKWILRILAALALIAFVWGWFDYRADANSGKHAKFLWWERNILKGYPDTVYTTLTKHDTVGVTVYPDYMDNIKRPSKIKRAVTGNSQKIDSGSSGIQNNAPNFGPQAGRDLTINGNTYRHPEPILIKQFIDSVPDRKTNITLAYVNNDDESKKYCQELRDILMRNGYSTISFFNQGVYGTVAPIGRFFFRNPDGSVFLKIVLN